MIEKEHICFLWNNQYFELDRYKGTNEGLAILEVEQFEIPPFISIEKKITGDLQYGTRNMAAKHRKIKV